MGSEQRPGGGSVGEASFPVPTGGTVELPLSMEGTVLGAVFSAPREAVTALLPEGLSPVRATPRGRAAVSFLSVEYRRLGTEALDPYDEFAVLLPAVPESATTLPYVSAVTRATRGYVWYLPVTTEPARTLGVDAWGLPKVLGEVTHEDVGSRRRTTVAVDGESLLTLEVSRPPAVERADESAMYARQGGELVRVPSEVRGHAGFWPFSTDVDLTLGEHPRAQPLRDLDLGDRALARVAVDGTATLHPGEPLAPGE
ncbi:MAG: acetoacetate decarboxylase family protein [Halobacteriaceae archaeon]